MSLGYRTGAALLLLVAGVTTNITSPPPCTRLLEHVILPGDALPPYQLNASWTGWDWERLSSTILEEVSVLSVALLTAGGETRVVYREQQHQQRHGIKQQGILSTPSSSVTPSDGGGSRAQQGYRTSLILGPGWSSPLWDCRLDTWLVGYVSITSRGSVGVYFRVDSLDLDQCDERLAPLFSSPPFCDKLTTQCIKSSSGLYRCTCLFGYEPPQLITTNESVLKAELLLDNYYHRCEPICGEGCWAQSGLLLRAAFTSVQICCILLTLFAAFLIFRRRKCKPVAHGMWTILEMLLFGILLLYSSVIPQLFEPSQSRCIIERWIRELGFIICYGAIILKLYRILMEFRSRKAHRFVVRDKDLMKYLFGMVTVTVAYLSAWTATMSNFSSEGYSLIAEGVTSTGEHFHTCKYLWWDSVTQIGEIVLLIFGLNLGLAARNASAQFVELRYLLWAITTEASVSMLYYAVLPTASASLHPSRLLVATFIRSQLTNTLVLLLIFLPIIVFNHKPVRDSRHHLTHEPSDAYKPDGVPSDIEVAEVNISDMNPEEIRAELKRLYTQLEILKNKTIRQNNPHISKRRGGRKVAHRRFSLQKKGSREKALQQKQKAAAKTSTSQGVEVIDLGEQEVSRTPEDSVCSIEGPSVVDGPTVTYSELTVNTPHHNPSK